MKRYNEYLPEEMEKLTDNELENLVYLEIAYAGIIPEEYPVLTSAPTVDIKPTVKAYECDNVYFDTIENANTFQNMKRFARNYDYSLTGTSDFVCLDEKNARDYSNGIKTAMFYEKNDIEKIKHELKRIGQIKKSNESLSKNYSIYIESINCHRDNVYMAHRESVETMNKRKKALSVYKKHLELADNNKEIAEKFFRDAYKDYPDIINYVMSEMF